MNSPIDAVLQAVERHGLRSNGPARWRAACPVCGENNRSTLSIGVGDNGCVLLKCWKHGCGPDEIAHALGLHVQDLFPLKAEGHRIGQMRRRHLLSAGQALDLLHDEAQLVSLAASNLGYGVLLTDEDRSRLRQSAGRVDYLRYEVMA